MRSLRPRSIAPPAAAMFAALDRDGIVVIPDFLTPDELAKLNAEYRTLRSQVQFKQFRERDGRLSVARMALSQNKELAPEFNRLLGQHPLIQSLGAAVARVNRASPTLELTIFRLDNPDAPDNDDENLLHADLHTPTLKCFYYLNDVDAGNGAFIYAKGSSRMSPARIKYEYDLSVRTARLKRGDRDVDGVEERLGTARALA